MKRDIDLLNDDITTSIIKLSMPLMGTAFIQMAYSLVDLIWLGKLSTEAVAAVGSIGFFIWISMALTLIAKTGLSVRMSQAYGKKDNESLVEIIRSGFQVNAIIYLTISLIYFLLKDKLIGFYRLDPLVESLADKYFTIIIIGLIFTFSAPILSSVYYSKGNSSTPFKVSTIGLVFNIIVDPLLIFGIGVFPKLGIVGAALATVLSQAIIVLIYLLLGIRNSELYIRVNYLEKFNLKKSLDIFKLGYPAALQSIIHASVGIVFNRFISSFGAAAISAFAIGSQIESISWMSADGFSVAFSSIFGQNYGAEKFSRLKKARREGLKILSFLGIFAAGLLFFAGEYLFKIFIPSDAEVIRMGTSYLKINAISELFMAYEIGTTGMLNGLGLTKYPAINAVVFNILRIPMALFLIPILGVNGIWLAISISSIIKGIIIILIYTFISNKTDGFKLNMDKYIDKG